MEPKRTQEKDCVRIDHPSFAMIGATRVTGGATSLFGSPVRVGSYVEITISRASCRERDLREDYRPETRLATVRMSETQWAALISRMNVGDGVPATLSYGPPEGTGLAQYPEIDARSDAEKRSAAISDTLRKNLEAAQETLAKLKAISEGKGSIPKTDLKEAVRSLEIALANAPSNFRYAADELTKHMDKVVTTAKTELNAHAMALGFEPGGQLAIGNDKE